MYQQIKLVVQENVPCLSWQFVSLWLTCPFTCNSIWEALVGINLEISIYVGSLWARLLYGQSFSSLILYFITINEISKASFYVPKWEAEDKGNVIARSSLSSSETLIIWYFTFLKYLSFFYKPWIARQKSYRLKQKFLCTSNDTCLGQ